MAITILTSSQKKILNLLAKDKTFSELFYLSGGTALAEYYLHHRISEDLDFFTPKEIDNIWLITLANKIKKTIGFKKLDLEESFNRNLIHFTTRGETVKTEFTYYPFTQIEPETVKNGIRVDSLADIAVNKFFTIYQKPTARHFIDLYLIIKTNKYHWKELIKLARIKFDTHIDPIQLGSQLVKADKIMDLPKMLIKISNEEWRNYFIEQAKRLKSKLAE